ncbi:MAG: tRNA (adenosine(37)-N6)-dimethylallyltransferase MiaA [Gammaproteobacteria bacterium]|nr:tRNA (adenosine(37)-N6)-dimethylallyltransferase MiaA [Gammaproteobacteria bacterium]
MVVKVKKVLALIGPTAAGKTALAIELTQRLPCDIISVDSSMVYRGMDIGTAKPTQKEQELAPHRLIDIRDPIDTYSAAAFRLDALREIEDILQHDRIPLLVGGTMLYFKVLQQGLTDLPSADPAVREMLAKEAALIGWSAMHEKLFKVDPKAAARINPNDAQRIGRALEIYEISGSTMTALFAEKKPTPLPYNVINIAVAPAERSIIHERIAKRLQQMLDNSFVDEVAELRSNILAINNSSSMPPSMRAVGYRQIWQYLEGDLTKAEMIEKAIIATRQLAKRQLTWLRSWPDLKWFDSKYITVDKLIPLIV